MRQLLLEYLYIVGYSIVGFVFGISFFLLFINLYHCVEVNGVYKKNNYELNSYKRIEDVLNKINKNIYTNSSNNSNSISDKLKTCVNIISDSDTYTLMSKKNVTIRDVYMLQQNLQDNIINECLIKQIYPITNKKYDNNIINDYNLLLKNNIDMLRYRNNYLLDNVKNNSSYYFSSDNFKMNVFDVTKDNYYEVMSLYTDSLDLLYDFSLLYVDYYEELK